MNAAWLASTTGWKSASALAASARALIRRSQVAKTPRAFGSCDIPHHVSALSRAPRRPSVPFWRNSVGNAGRVARWLIGAGSARQRDTGSLGVGGSAPRCLAVCRCGRGADLGRMARLFPAAAPARALRVPSRPRPRGDGRPGARVGWQAVPSYHRPGDHPSCEAASRGVAVRIKLIPLAAGDGSGWRAARESLGDPGTESVPLAWAPLPPRTTCLRVALRPNSFLPRNVRAARAVQ